MMFSEKLRVTNHVQCGSSYYRLGFEAPHFAAETAPGQFFMIAVGCGTDPFLRRPMSLHRFVRDGDGNPTGFELLYKIAGRGTELLSRVCVGDTIPVLGPLGHGFRIAEAATDHLIVTGGTGVAPMVALAEALVLAKIRPKVLYGARVGAELVCKRDFELLGADLTVFTDDGSLGAKGLVTDGLENLVRTAHGGEASEPTTAIYGCGPHGMLATLARMAERAEVPCQLSLESRMGCGLGACMSCVVHGARTEADEEPRYIQVCLQGPVIDSRRISWENEVGCS